MALTITGKNFTLTDGIKEAVQDQVEKLQSLLPENADVKAVLSAKHGKREMQKAELTIRAGKTLVRAEVSGDDMYQSIADATDIAEVRLKKVKDKERRMERAGSESIRMGEQELPLLLNGKRISRRKMVEAAVMSGDAACEEMELTGHSFYLFRNADMDEQLCAVYIREEGDYGILVID